MNRTKLSITEIRNKTTDSPKLAERLLDSNIAEFQQHGDRLSRKIQQTVGTVSHLTDRIKAPARKMEEIKAHPEPYLVALNGALLLYIFYRFLRA